jgi:hypothetical protein
MNEDFSAAADIATGTLIARAVEPEAGESRDPANAPCLNCGATLSGHHCHHCGQKAKVHRSLSAFGHDILHSVLHFDGKIWRTLPLLAWYPGELTRRYVHGERARFVSPIAMFLFSVFLSFAAFNWLVPSDISFENRSPATAQEAAKILANDRAEVIADIEKLKKERAEALTAQEPVQWIDTEIAAHQGMLTNINSKKIPEVRKQQIAERKLSIETRKLEARIAELNADLARAKKSGAPTQSIIDDIESENEGLKLLKAASSVIRDDASKPNIDVDFFGIESLNVAAKKAIKNPQLLLYKVQSNAYKYSWLLIPLSVPFLWLLFFWRREYKLFDHAVFVTYSLCFMMTLAVIGGMTLSVTGEDDAFFPVIVLALVLIPPVHMYRQIHRAYQTTRWGAIWRTVALSNFALFALLLFTLLILTLGVTG